MVNLEISFHSNDEFTVRTKVDMRTFVCGPQISETTYQHEDDFLRFVIAANLDDATTTQLVAAVIESAGRMQNAGRWISASLSEEQIAILRLNLREQREVAEERFTPDTSTQLPNLFLNNAAHFYDFLMNAPTPFVMLSGPDHVFTFINAAYVQLLGRSSSDQLLGLPVRQALPDPGFDVCLGVLQKAYDTGIPQVRKELLNSFRQEDTGLQVEAYFDIVYHPVRDMEGKVVGIMAQATDVTERVLSRQVSESREQKLYRLWAELEGIYAAAPVGIAVIEPIDFNVLRTNKRQAKFFGATTESLLHTSLHDSANVSPELVALLTRAAAGEKLVEVPLDSAENGHGLSFFVSVIPSLDPSGHVETITLITLDVAAHGQAAEQMHTVGAG